MTSFDLGMLRGWLLAKDAPAEILEIVVRPSGDQPSDQIASIEPEAPPTPIDDDADDDSAPPQPTAFTGRVESVAERLARMTPQEVAARTTSPKLVNGRAKWTPEMDAQLIRGVGDGRTIADMAAEFGLKYQQTFYRVTHMRLAGKLPPASKKEETDEEPPMGATTSETWRYGGVS